MKKIGIMTWFRYENYGTALQASALSYILKKNNYNCDLIDYVPRTKYIKYKKNICIPKKIIKKFYNHFFKKKKNNQPYKSAIKTELFNNYLNDRVTLSKQVKTTSELSCLNNQYDTFICGSDQIWSPSFFDDNYYLSFVNSENKKIAYAPSLGTSCIDDPIIKNSISNLVKNFDYLSVREERGREIINEISNKDAKVVLDPTMLLTNEEWDKYANVDSSKKIESKYILCYFLGDESKYLKNVKQLSKKYNLDYYIIPTTIEQLKLNKNIPFEVGPSEFLSLIKNAEIVCTDSFHGAIFSLIYEKPFVIYKRFSDKDKNGQNSRIYNILKMFKIEDRLNIEINNVYNIEKIKIKNILEKKRTDSLNFIISALQGNKIIKNKFSYSITKKCCGCGLCKIMCPKNAIAIEDDEHGFQQSYINADNCVKCGICKKICPLNNLQFKNLRDSIGLYSIQSKNDEALKESSSGGVGYEISKLLNNKNFYVCGSYYNKNNNRAEHILIEPNNKENLYKLQGSKYIQSRTFDALSKIYQLDKSSKLLFFGTPCQVAAVDKILKIKGMRENCILVDLICHGVPSSLVWDKYLSERNNKNKTGIHPFVRFRNKNYSWRQKNISLGLDKNDIKYFKNETKDDFYAFFLKPLIYMDLCFDCPFRENSYADIRIGDYWGPKFSNDKKGVSMVIAITDRGYDIVKQLNQNCYINKQSINEYWSVQFPFNPIKPLYYNNIFEDLKNKQLSLKKLRKKYCKFFEQHDKIQKYYKYLGVLKKIIKK